MSKPWKWFDAEDGSYSELRLGREDPTIHAAAWQPVDRNRLRTRSWETAIAVRSEGLGLSQASSKVDAEMSLRRDAERIVAALGGKVVWGEEA